MKPVRAIMMAAGFGWLVDWIAPSRPKRSETGVRSRLVPGFYHPHVAALPQSSLGAPAAEIVVESRMLYKPSRVGNAGSLLVLRAGEQGRWPRMTTRSKQ